MYISNSFLSPMSIFLSVFVVQVLCSAVGLYLWYIECTRVPLVSVISWLSGRILREANSGAVCAVYFDFVIVRMAFFCIKAILFRFLCEVQLYIGRQ